MRWNWRDRQNLDAFYIDIGSPVGSSAFLPMVSAHGTMVCRHRAPAPDLIDRIPSSARYVPLR